MAYPTLGSIIQDVILEAGLVSGTGVQTYTEPLVRVAVNRMFDILFMKQRWQHLWTWETKTLDGATGLVTTAFENVRQWEDIALVRVGNTSRGIPRAIEQEHLYGTGAQAMYWRPLLWDHADAETKFIQFFPIASVGTVDVLVGHRPEAFVDNEDIVPFDKTVITEGTLWNLLASDGLNPAAADKAQGLFDIAYNDYVARIGTMEIGHGGGNYANQTFTIQQ